MTPMCVMRSARTGSDFYPTDRVSEDWDPAVKTWRLHGCSNEYNIRMNGCLDVCTWKVPPDPFSPSGMRSVVFGAPGTAVMVPVQRTCGSERGPDPFSKMPTTYFSPGAIGTALVPLSSALSPSPVRIWRSGLDHRDPGLFSQSSSMASFS